MIGAPLLYLHGLPGSFASEMDIVFGPAKRPDGLESLNRLGPLGGGLPYADTLIDAFDEMTRAPRLAGPVRLVAFSLGSMAALRIAAARADRIASLDLIAPAAPLQLGDFLDAMAGKPVFEAAQQGEFRLGLLARMQSVALTIAPSLIARQLFAASSDAERKLMGAPERRGAFLAGMKQAVHHHPAAYKAELRAYVTDWSAMLAEVRSPVRIWQGTDDNWAPAAMAQALASALMSPAEIILAEGLSHYGVLVQSLPKIIAGGPAEQASHRRQWQGVQSRQME